MFLLLFFLELPLDLKSISNFPLLLFFEERDLFLFCLEGRASILSSVSSIDKSFPLKLIFPPWPRDFPEASFQKR